MLPDILNSYIPISHVVSFILILTELHALKSERQSAVNKLSIKNTAVLSSEVVPIYVYFLYTPLTIKDTSTDTSSSHVYPPAIYKEISPSKFSSLSQDPSFSAV